MNKVLVFAGTEVKLNVNISPIEGMSMENYEFKVQCFTSARKVITIGKEKAIKVDADNYKVCVDTTGIGSGELRCKITAYLPDNDFADKLRTEVVEVATNITIV
jgi:hypothetical protein